MPRFFSWIWRAFLIIALQVLVARQLSLIGGGTPSIQIFLYPILLIWMPMSVPRYAQLLLAFALGLIVDIFYGTYGIHASASVWLAFVRPHIINYLEPAGGYRYGAVFTRSNYSLGWFVSFVAAVLLLHLLWYYSVEQFSFVYIERIIKRTLSSFLLSFLTLLIFQFILDGDF